MSLLNKLFKKPSSFAKAAEDKKPRKKVSEHIVETPKKTESVKKIDEFKSDGILISPLNTEKATSSQTLNKYIFKVASKANKIDIIKAVSKIYSVKAISANIINIPKKSRPALRGKTRGFKSGYKKAIVTLAKGQSIEVK